MRRYVLSDGCFSVSVRYLTKSRDGVFWFYRRIPITAKVTLGLTTNFVRVSLSTRDRSEAIRRLVEVNAKYEAQWSSASPRSEKEHNSTLWRLIDQTPAGEATKRSLESSGASTAAIRPALPLLSEALDLYLSQHPNGASKRFKQNAKLCMSYVFDAVGDLPLDRYTRLNALAERGSLPSRQAG